MTDCLMREAAFQIIGPCDVSPSGPGSFWTCLPPEGDSAGTCYGDSLDMFNTIACIPPSCPDHVLDFEMRTFHCSCNGPNCGVICHFMPNNTWKITIEGRTVEENPIQSAQFPDVRDLRGRYHCADADRELGRPTLRVPLAARRADRRHDLRLAVGQHSLHLHRLRRVRQHRHGLAGGGCEPRSESLLGPFEDCEPTVELDAGDGWFSYFWPHSGETSQTVTVDSPGFYTVFVEDGFGCVGESQPIDAIIHPPPVVDAFPDTIIIDEGALAELFASSTSPGLVNYTWGPEGTLTCNDCPNPLAFPSTDQIYFVVGEQFGCVGEPDSLIVLVNQVDLVLPNAFTPNADGLNDVFRVTNPALYPVFEMAIFTRWGERVYHSADIRSGWDGTHQGRDAELGVYIWMIRYRKGTIDGEEVRLAGNVTLVR